MTSSETELTLPLIGKEYTFNPQEDQILKYGVVCPYDLSSKRGKWVVLDEYIFWSARIQSPIIIPRWFITDLMSIPEIFRWFMDKDDQMSLASLPHDFGYSTSRSTHLERSDWDLILLDFCKQQRMSWLKRNIAYAAVRLGGWYGWSNKKKDLFIPDYHKKWYINNYNKLNPESNLVLDSMEEILYII